MKTYDLVEIESRAGLSITNVGINMGLKVAIVEESKMRGKWCLSML